MKSRSHQAFTLIEMLVVIAIIALLAAFLVPAISSARKKADSGVCRNGLKNLATAVVSFSTDREDWLPPGPPGSVRISSGVYSNGLTRGQRAVYANETAAGGTKFSVQQLAYHLTRYLDLDLPGASFKDSPTLRCVSAWKSADKSLQNKTNLISYAVSQRKLYKQTVEGADRTAFGDATKAGPMKFTQATDIVKGSELWMLTDADRQNEPLHTPNTELLEKPAHGASRNVVYFDSHIDSVKISTTAAYKDIDQDKYSLAEP